MAPSRCHARKRLMRWPARAPQITLRVDLPCPRVGHRMQAIDILPRPSMSVFFGVGIPRSRRQSGDRAKWRASTTPMHSPECRIEICPEYYFLRRHIFSIMLGCIPVQPKDTLNTLSTSRLSTTRKIAPRRGGSRGWSRDIRCIQVDFQRIATGRYQP